MNVAYISLGSNIKDRLDHLTEAVRALHKAENITVTAISSIYETAPVGYTEQADFLNLVVCVETDLAAHALLSVCQEIEQQQGRVRKIRWGPRTVDLDILLYNNDNIESENLVVPHPRMRERAFVLIPLLEISPNAIDSATGKSLAGEDAIHDTGVICFKRIDGVEQFLERR